ncbi:MAG TPA: bifunctional demethylmenaquinone methyltransferase/2-methoxy-6-polyprenyl-1,4-benzoquinol methylase UbiE [Bacteroidota bacterium]|nr:bifunctional demethylmenaquinone methyltransferase/2-methoxy-6-polyprenyl-1,4-benzoquinol methylase UbiE [Bacteroidota bacterium]
MEKQYVRTLFDSIARHYDFLNHLLSGGVDLYWRRAAIRSLKAFSPRSILDVATGTADLAIASLRLNPDEVIGVDISAPMLEIGKRKIEAIDASGRIQLQLAEAEHLPFPEGRFDAAMVAFGVRNFEDLFAGLREMHRVLKKGGKVAVLEFSKPRVFPFRQIYLFYFTRLLPLIGRAISRKAEAYRYLPETVLAFPDGDDFVQILESAGFSSITYRRLTLGIASLYCGEKQFHE